MGQIGLSLFRSNIGLDMASTTVNRLVHLSWTYEKTDTPALCMPDASSRSSYTFLVLLYWPHMHQVAARTHLVGSGIYTYSQWPLESLPIT